MIYPSSSSITVPPCFLFQMNGHLGNPGVNGLDVFLAALQEGAENELVLTAHVKEIEFKLKPEDAHVGSPNGQGNFFMNCS